MPTTPTDKIDLLKNSSYEDKMDLLIAAVTASTPADGFSPTVTVSKTGDVATISVTDKTGTTTATITDGTGAGDMEKDDFATIDPTHFYVDNAINAKTLNNMPASHYENKVMTGASAAAAGESGIVPAPTALEYEKFLRGDGTWQEVKGESALERQAATLTAGTSPATVSFTSNYLKATYTDPITYKILASVKNHNVESTSIDTSTGTITFTFPTESVNVSYVFEIYNAKV